MIIYNTFEIKILSDLIINHPHNLTKKLKLYYNDLFTKIGNDNIIGKDLKCNERVYKIVYNIQNNLCIECNLKSTKFISVTAGYAKFCSQACKKKSPLITQKVKETCLKRYNVDNFSKTDEFKKNNLGFKDAKIQEKALKSKIEKYGYNFSNPIKTAETKKNKYGDSRYCNKEQIIKTNLEKYGTKSFTSTDIGKEILSRKNKENSQDRNIKNKNTLLLRYNVENASLVPGSREKAKFAMFSTFYNKLIESNRLKDLVIPLFNLNDYNGIYKKYKFYCKKCNIEFFDDLNNGKVPRCLECFPLYPAISKFHEEVLEFIKTFYTGSIIVNTSNIISPYELDIYLPDIKLAIECNGVYWHSELAGNKDKNYHLNKLNRCEELDIHLLQIFDCDWYNKQDIIKNRILSYLNISKSLYARKCNIQEISNKESNEFLNNMHLQGGYNSKINFGIFYEYELVAVFSFGIPRYSDKKNTNVLELIRYSSKYKIPGIFNRVLKIIKNKYTKFNKIISFANRCWTSKFNNFYLKNNFILGEISGPSYYYTNNYTTLFNRVNFQKHKLKNKLLIYDKSLSEWQNMQINKYDRIWDCGNLKYELDF